MSRFDWRNLAIYSDEEINAAARKEPSRAIMYASGFLTPDTLDWCAREAPYFSLMSPRMCCRLTSETLDYCARREPWAALQYSAELLTPETIDWCARRQPECALEYAKQYLSSETIKQIEDQLLIQKLTEE
jgi:hypothetical protein